MPLRPPTYVLIAAIAMLASADNVANRWHEEVAVPRLDALKQASVRLRSAADDMCTRTNQERLTTMREAWMATFAAWRAAEPVVLDNGLRMAIEPGPAELQAVEAGVHASTADAPVAAAAPAGARGLQAQEYLLWGNDRAAAQLGRLAFRQRCQYVQALADAVPAQVDGLIAADQAVADRSMAGYLDRISAELKLLNGSRLGRLGEGNKQPAPMDFDGWRSKQTKRAMAMAVGTVEELLIGPGGSGGYLTELYAGEAGAKRLAKLREDFDAVHAILAKLPDDLPDSLTRHPNNAQPLIDRLHDIEAVVAELVQATKSPAATPVSQDKGN